MQNGFFNDASMDVFVVVVWSHVPDLKMLSLAPVFVRRGRLATAHRCIWKIGQCGSMERWPGPQHVGWKLRKHNSWDDLDNNTKRPGAWTISALDTSQCCPLWGVFCSQNIVFSFQCRQRLGKILKTRCICFWVQRAKTKRRLDRPNSTAACVYLLAIELLPTRFNWGFFFVCTYCSSRCCQFIPQSTKSLRQWEANNLSEWRSAAWIIYRLLSAESGEGEQVERSLGMFIES